MPDLCTVCGLFVGFGATFVILQLSIPVWRLSRSAEKKSKLKTQRIQALSHEQLDCSRPVPATGSQGSSVIHRIPHFFVMCEYKPHFMTYYSVFSSRYFWKRKYDERHNSPFQNVTEFFNLPLNGMRGPIFHIPNLLQITKWWDKKSKCHWQSYMCHPVNFNFMC